MRILAVLALLTVFSSCQVKEEKTVNNIVYFDLPGYFKGEAKRLQNHGPSILKTVSLDGQIETKTIAIKDWEREFGAFIDANINKASWLGAFQVQKTDTSKIYTTNNQKIAVKRLEVGEQQGKVSFIKITVKNDNDLYTADDELTYFPDSLYQIRKVQQVKLMAKKTFEVTGRFK